MMIMVMIVMIMMMIMIMMIMMMMRVMTAVVVHATDSETNQTLDTLPMDVDDETKNRSKKTEMFTDRRRAAGVKKKHLKLRRGITVDPGVANNVMPRKMVRDRKKI